ncbi:Pfam:DUF821 [Geosmithia morbida]|uniref:Pfam:DUF821 n=1 Tax=Geosmithia morbida TaxID=1094350 RepID=A0A9P4Z417_9HYPO|nr:Pfam:DUF821 [Geosmithia morbida]KAF4126239.1 Pfam:DUF821 [Geosmithia morbida]
MTKIFTPAFPPRRPARYLLLAFAFLTLIYLHRSFSDPSRVALDPLQPVPPPPQSQPPDADPAPILDSSKPGPQSDIFLGDDIDSSEDEQLPPPPPPPAAHDPELDTSKGQSDSPYVVPPNVEPPAIEKPQDLSALRPSSLQRPHFSDEMEEKEEEEEASSGFDSKKTPPPGPEDAHPIDRLVYDAQHVFAELMSKETDNINDAAQAYRKRRGRHPPPGFDKWFHYAQSRHSVIVEDFFDQIYHDLEPFWGLPPATLRKESWDFEMTIHIREGKAVTSSDWFWTVIWLDLIDSIQHLLPDMDIALNPMDEPRIVTPWEDMEKYMIKAKKTVKLPKATKVRSEFQTLPDPAYGDFSTATRKKVFEETNPYWAHVRRGCPPDSLARTTPLQESFADPPNISMANAKPHMYEGFVSNYTMSTELCHQPDLQGLQGILIEPLSTSTTTTLFPLFGGSKLHVNNEILLPAPMYWNEEERFTGGDDHGVSWGNKADHVVWRGVATGGRNRESNWRGFQRHRFVSMNNATEILRAEMGDHEPENFSLPGDKDDAFQYNITAQEADQLAEWVDEWANVGFIDLNCEPPEEDGVCSYTSPHFDIVPGLRMVDQFNSKYLPDLDGNSFSGRYLGFLRSTSLPIKSTLFREWHDSRLLAWKHFVPMDNRYGDYYGLMDYFLGFNGKGGHDSVAKQIAQDGKDWAEKVLRKEDMQIYTLRLLLEYARLLDDDREILGWVEDILRDPSLEKDWSL